MSKLKSISTSFWTDGWVEKLEPINKLLFLYLLTNSQNNMLGAFELSQSRISFETGIDQDAVSKGLNIFQADKKIIYKENWIILLNFLSHQKFNANMKKSAIDSYNQLPEYLKIKDLTEIRDRGEQGFLILCKGFGRVRKIETEVEVEDEVEKEIELNASPQKQFSDFSKDSYFAVDRLAEVYLEDEKLLNLVAKNTGKPVETLKSSMPDFIEKLKTENRGTETPGEFAKYFRNIHKGNFQINPAPKNTSDRAQAEYIWTINGVDKKHGSKADYEADKKSWDGFGFKTIKSPQYA